MRDTEQLDEARVETDTQPSGVDRSWRAGRASLGAALKKTRSSLLAVLAGALVGAVVIMLRGENPLSVYSALLAGAFDRYGLPNTLRLAVPIVGAGLAAALAFRAGFFTLGVEGQLALGGLSAALVAIVIGDMGFLSIVVPVVAAACVGGIWSGLAATFEFRWGVPILISTLLMNYPAVLLCSYLVSGPLRERGAGVSQTAELPEAARFAEMVSGTRLSAGGLITLLICFLLAFVLVRTSFGYEVRMAGLNPDFSTYGGVRLRRVGYLVMLGAGAIAGLAGAIEVMGVHYRFIDGALTTPLYAWIGLMAALLADFNPVGVLVAGLFFAGLQTGGLEIERSTDLTRELSLILQSIIIIFVASRGAFRARERFRNARRTVDVAGGEVV